jgi:hypothetical protein
MELFTIMSSYYDGNFNQADQHGPMRIRYPFYAEGDNVTRVIERDYMQKISRFKSLPLNAVDPQFSDCYLVQETDPEIVGADVGLFTRIYSSIPQSRVVSEQFFWNRPGTSGVGGSSILQEEVTSPSAVTRTSDGYVVYPLSTANTFTAGDTVTVTESYSQGWQNPAARVGGLTLAVRLRGVVISANPSGPSTVTVRLQGNTSNVFYNRLFQNGSGLASIKIEKVLASRAAGQIVVNAKVVCDYFLPGISKGVATVDNIEIYEPFKIFVVSGGNVTETDTLTASTVPTVSEYFQWVNDSRELVAEYSTLQRYWGNIWERKTRYVVAI